MIYVGHQFPTIRFTCALKVSGSEVNKLQVYIPKVGEANVDTSISWNYPANGFEHYKLEFVSNYKIKTKDYEIAKIGVKESIDLYFRINYSLLTNIVF